MQEGKVVSIQSITLIYNKSRNEKLPILKQSTTIYRLPRFPSTTALASEYVLISKFAGRPPPVAGPSTGTTGAVVITASRLTVLDCWIRASGVSVDAALLDVVLSRKMPGLTSGAAELDGGVASTAVVPADAAAVSGATSIDVSMLEELERMLEVLTAGAAPAADTMSALAVALTAAGAESVKGTLAPTLTALPSPAGAAAAGTTVSTGAAATSVVAGAWAGKETTVRSVVCGLAAAGTAGLATNWVPARLGNAAAPQRHWQSHRPSARTVPKPFALPEGTGDGAVSTLIAMVEAAAMF